MTKCESIPVSWTQAALASVSSAVRELAESDASWLAPYERRVDSVSSRALESMGKRGRAGLARSSLQKLSRSRFRIESPMSWRRSTRWCEREPRDLRYFRARSSSRQSRDSSRRFGDAAAPRKGFDFGASLKESYRQRLRDPKAGDKALPQPAKSAFFEEGRTRTLTRMRTHARAHTHTGRPNAGRSGVAGTVPTRGLGGLATASDSP